METKRRATVRFAIPFADVDAMQLVWHGNYFKYFDMARDQLYRDAGVDLYRIIDNGIVFPVTRTQTKYIRPLRFRDEVDCTAILVEAEYRLVVDFEIRLADGVLCTRGRTEQVAVRVTEPNPTLELRVPESIRTALTTPPA